MLQWFGGSSHCSGDDLMVLHSNPTMCALFRCSESTIRRFPNLVAVLVVEMHCAGTAGNSEAGLITMCLIFNRQKGFPRLEDKNRNHKREGSARYAHQCVQALRSGEKKDKIFKKIHKSTFLRKDVRNF